MFCTRSVRPIYSSNLTHQSFKPLLREAGLPEIRFHDLRHTCATLLLGKVVHPRIVQDLLGHFQISLTLDIYSHILPGMHTGAVSAMGEVFGRNPEEEGHP